MTAPRSRAQRASLSRDWQSQTSRRAQAPRLQNRARGSSIARRGHRRPAGRDALCPSAPTTVQHVSGNHRSPPLSSRHRQCVRLSPEACTARTMSSSVSRRFRWKCRVRCRFCSRCASGTSSYSRPAERVKPVSAVCRRPPPSFDSAAGIQRPRLTGRSDAKFFYTRQIYHSATTSYLAGRHVLAYYERFPRNP